jgi:hypothetical protein
MPKRAKEGAGLRRNQPAAQPQSQQETLNAARALSEAKRAEGAKEPVGASAKAAPAPQSGSAPATPAGTAPRPYAFDDDDLDIPDFLK